MSRSIALACDDAVRLPRSLVRALHRRARRAARAMGCTDAQLEGLTLRIVDDPTMRELKQRHFGLDEAADDKARRVILRRVVRALDGKTKR